ncbi:MAG: hypothetical protein PVG07_11380 [Acidobacteriota bacterium]
MRPLALATLALAGFALTSALLGRIAPYPEMGDLDDKLRWLEDHGDEYDVLFAGSSRVLRGVIPEEFDAELARRGHPVRSFNLGVDGMGAHETDATLRRVLEGKPKRLRWVVVELDGWTAALRPENRFKARVVFWHDLPETLTAVRTAALSGESPGARAELVSTHLLHCAARTTAAGRGRDLVERWRSALRRLPTGRPGPDLDRGAGFEPFSPSAYGTPSTHPFRRRFLTMLPAYRRAVDRLPAANRAPVELSPPDAHAVAEQTTRIRQRGAVPVHLITPTARPTPELYRLAAEGRVPHLLAFNRPRAYPELFALEHRFDAEHLTTEGARRFSRLLAARFADEVLADPAPDPAPAPGTPDER